jgi:hypothetical protein
LPGELGGKVVLDGRVRRRLSSLSNAWMNMPSPGLRQSRTARWFTASRVSAATGQAATTSMEACRSRVVSTPQEGEEPTPTIPATVTPERS